MDLVIFSLNLVQMNQYAKLRGPQKLSFLLLRGIKELSIDIMIIIWPDARKSGLTPKDNTGLRLSAKIIEHILVSYKGAKIMVFVTDQAQKGTFAVYGPERFGFS